ncbi:MAG: type II secretion system F family protein [Candidatus Omnitrophica bacterium]|nr:type II secretion system F family protein [Candidatus Omnitrophota bacterium]
MEILIYLFLMVGILLILLSIFGTKAFSESRLKLPQEEGRVKKANLYTFLAGIIPFTSVLLEKLKLYEKIKHNLDAAHARFTVQAFFNLKILLMAGLAVLAFFLFGKLEPPAFIVCLGLGYIIPDIFIKQMIKRRKSAIATLLPETVDLLGLCVEAGLDFTTASRWIIEKTPMNPMLEELTFVLEEIKWGKSRSQALKDMSRRLNIPEVSSFVQTLVLAERMGTPVAEAFMILSEDARMQRFHRGERVALQAPMKILIPLIFCILPVIGIVIGGPIFIDFMTKKMF